MPPTRPRPAPRNRVAYWSELKLEIVRGYAATYSRVLSRQPGLAHYYVDGFSGADVHVPEHPGEFVAGSPLNSLLVQPPFRHHYLVDVDGGRTPALRRLAGDRADVSLLEGDPSAILLRDVFPQVRHEDYRRALCLLDPRGLGLDWEVVERAGRQRTIDLFVSLPLVDGGGRALWTDAARVPPAEAGRMTRFWGDASWHEAAEHAGAQTALFDEPAGGKAGALGAPAPPAIVRAFRRRLREVARFENVPEPLALRNADDEVVSWLFLASRNDTANRVLEDLFARYRDGRPRVDGDAGRREGTAKRDDRVKRGAAPKRGHPAKPGPRA